jgi:hypothetical protein
VRSGPGEARTILLLHIISVRPSKPSAQAYGTYLPQGVYGARLLFFVSARTNRRHHHLGGGRRCGLGRGVGVLGGPGLVLMCCVVLAAAQLWGGRLLAAGHWSSIAVCRCISPGPAQNPHVPPQPAAATTTQPKAGSDPHYGTEFSVRAVVG